jgi:hypothetical protein
MHNNTCRYIDIGSLCRTWPAESGPTQQWCVVRHWKVTECDTSRKQQCMHVFITSEGTWLWVEMPNSASLRPVTAGSGDGGAIDKVIKTPWLAQHDVVWDVNEQGW